MSKILLDLDGVVVLYDFHHIVKDFFGVDLSPLLIYAYDLADVLGVSNKAIDLMFRENVYGNPCFAEGAIETLNLWKSQGHHLIIFSNRTKYMGEFGLGVWLVKNKIPFSGIDVAGVGEYDFHIDDSPAKLANTNSQTKLLYNQSWNKNCFDIKHQFIRVKNWKEVRECTSTVSSIPQTSQKM